MAKVLMIARLSLAGGLGVATWAAAAAQSGTPPAGQPHTPATQGGCYDEDANGKQVFVPNCGLPNLPGAPEYKPGEDAPQQNKVQGTPQQTPAKNPAQAFPFPGEENTPLVLPDGSVVPPGAGQAPASAAGAGDGAGGLKDAGSSGESSSSSSSSSSSAGGFAGLGPDPEAKGPLADDDTVLKKPRKKLPPPKVQTDNERVAEDLSVADFYMGDKNFRAAYLRASDAVSLAADDPNSHFALAEAARKLGKLDQAMAEYRKTLTLDPIPREKKAAEKAVKEMGG